MTIGPEGRIKAVKVKYIYDENREVSLVRHEAKRVIP